MYDPELSVQVKSDASSTAVGAVLKQQYGDVWHPVEYFYKRLNDTEFRYSATKQYNTIQYRRATFQFCKITIELVKDSIN